MKIVCFPPITPACSSLYASLLEYENLFIIKSKLRSISDISITAPEYIENKIKMLAAGLHMDRSAVIRSIIDAGVRQKLIEYALNQYMEKKVSLAKAAEIAGDSIREMLDILNEKGIPLHISQKSIMEDFEAAMQ